MQLITSVVNTSLLVVRNIVSPTYIIGILVIGKNENWKQNLNIGKRNNQSFTQIPHARLIDQIAYKCQLAGIKVVVTLRILYLKDECFRFRNTPQTQYLPG
ncbi:MULTISPECIES: IS200/IS605 family accessory protein TnpB-related protein [Microcoleus]|uniref:IS200/IS605 family accessory protein TnpB-related protein n=1 Tax=Microcoleus anatoxicus PTRS2 TaxID=2705321 RepID=A0ABU8YG43_9CYAN|nr:MAG: hypothetical protein EA000_17180 [Oscillatoriales cyanobacterium]TAD95530.1 MAG: hypothetical protein EAZ98_15465 [Oscillatoriales cyanobacterium]TAE01062.1 MAG: hypothetical protein EAZ96_19995 [Oscillatoriales cyanobacterium]TAF04483.1 MAG: hypothetical protein EAZ78_08905 [Oscillatoriales cyanobacterium]TAF40534.1 MAG: hypothetical protein EAZ68_11110 [Oscillatoriales cyanobacterium]